MIVRPTLRLNYPTLLLVAASCTPACSGSTHDGSSEAGGAPTSGGTSTRSATGSSRTDAPTGGADASQDTSGAGGRSNGSKSSAPSRGGAADADGGADTATARGGSSHSKAAGGATAVGGKSSLAASTTAGTRSSGGSGNAGGTRNSSGGATTSGSTNCASGPVGTISGELATGIQFMDTDGKPVNAHGGGIIQDGDTFYLHGEYFLSTTSDNDFNGFSMYSSKDLATWKNEGIILPQQANGELGPKRKGERPHIIKCPSTGEFVLYAHAASEDYQTDKEIVYATSPTVNGKYAYKGPLTNSSGVTAAHSDMSALADGDSAYVFTESGHVYTLASDCHSWISDKTYPAVNGDSSGSESPTVFKAGSTYYWIGSYKTGWRANNNFYSTASAITGPWTYQGFIAPVADKSTTTPSGSPNPPEWISAERTWLSQSTWVAPVVGCQGTVYVYVGDHWYGNQDTSNPGKHNDQATYVFQPLVFDGTKISMPKYLATWKLDVGAGIWTE